MTHDDGLDDFRDSVRRAGFSLTPYRLGRAVGESGQNLPSPYRPGTVGDRCFHEGVKWGRQYRTQDAAFWGPPRPGEHFHDWKRRKGAA